MTFSGFPAAGLKFLTELGTSFWEGPDKKAAPTLFVRVSEGSVGFASGMQSMSLARGTSARERGRQGCRC